MTFLYPLTTAQSRYSAAFDTLHHDKLITRLENIGIIGHALKWSKSFISNRFFRVIINRRISNPHPLKHGAPQGSVLCPLLFIILIDPIATISNNHSISYHMYAGDIQLYTTCNSPRDLPNKLATLNRCIDDISWLRNNSLCLYKSKTEALLIVSNSICTFPEQIQIFDNPTDCLNLIRNLCAVFDPPFNFDDHINKVK